MQNVTKILFLWLVTLWYPGGDIDKIYILSKSQGLESYIRVPWEQNIRYIYLPCSYPLLCGFPICWHPFHHKGSVTCSPRIAQRRCSSRRFRYRDIHREYTSFSLSMSQFSENMSGESTPDYGTPIWILSYLILVNGLRDMCLCLVAYVEFIFLTIIVVQYNS